MSHLSKAATSSTANRPIGPDRQSAKAFLASPSLIQLNRGEGRHQLARTIFHGKRGELRQRYREGQEDQLGALGLVVNLVVLWNTIYMDAALNQLITAGYDVKPEDVDRLSPLGLKHINMLGRYAFTLPDYVARGELRPMRDPSNANGDDA